MTDHSAIFEGEMVWELVTEIRGDWVIPCKGTIVWGCCREDHIWAELRNNDSFNSSAMTRHNMQRSYLVAAALAVVAFATGCAGLHGHAVSVLEVSYPATD